MKSHSKLIIECLNKFKKLPCLYDEIDKYIKKLSVHRVKRKFSEFIFEMYGVTNKLKTKYIYFLFNITSFSISNLLQILNWRMFYWFHERLVGIFILFFPLVSFSERLKRCGG